MATTAKIIINDPDVKDIAIYKHYDGYPAGTLPWLLKFHKDYMEKRGWDPEYELAQLLRSTKKFEEEFGLDPSNYTGWGIIKSDSCQTDFKYILDKDKIKVYQFDWESKEYDLIDEVDLNTSKEEIFEKF